MTFLLHKIKCEECKKRENNNKIIKCKLIIFLLFLILVFSYQSMNIVMAEEQENVEERKMVDLENEEPKIRFEDTNITLGVGEKEKLRITIEPSTTIDNVKYTSSDETTVLVDQNGVISGVSVGTATITATISNGNHISCLVTVKEAPDEIIVKNKTRTMKKGDSYEIVATLNHGYSRQNFSYQSDNEDIATVTEDGIVTALKSGKVKIIISTYNGEKVSVTILVVEKLGTIQMQYIKDASVTIGKGQSRTLYYNVSPVSLSNTVIKNLKWKSSNDKVVQVTENGTITGKKEGNAKITLYTEDNSAKELTLSIHVTKRVKGTNYSENNLDIVNTTKARYTYKEMVQDIKKLEQVYGDCLKVSTLADTYDNRDIYQIILGNENADKKIVIQSAIHAREYMTSLLTMKQIEFYCKNYYTGTYQGKYFSELFDNVAFYIVPMANPDGVTISQFGASGIVDKDLRLNVISMCKKYGGGRSSYYKTWKANVRGVDLNRNFNQHWNILRGDTGVASSQGYKGKSPVSEIETKTLVNLVKRVQPMATISYHATGSIIFWDFGQSGSFRKESYRLTKLVKSLTSYHLVKGFSKYQSTGFSDWVSINQKIPAITIEIGRGSCPLTTSEFDSIWSKNKLIYPAVAELYY